MDRDSADRTRDRCGSSRAAAAGLLLWCTVGDVVARGDSLFEIHAQSEAQLEFARADAAGQPDLVRFGF